MAARTKKVKEIGQVKQMIDTEVLIEVKEAKKVNQCLMDQIEKSSSRLKRHGLPESNIKKFQVDCMEYIENHFDEEELCQIYIYSLEVYSDPFRGDGLKENAQLVLKSLL